MIGLPKLLLIVLVVFAVWYAARAFNRIRPRMPQPRPQARPRIEAEDLVACKVCGTYIAASARHCGRAGCLQPR
jgi:hypothetical protein